MATQLGEGGGGLGVVALLAYDELALADVQLLVGEDVLQHQGPQLRDGHLALIHLIGLRLKDGALHVDVGLSLHAQLSQLLDAVVHTALLYLCHNI